jgi:hypothetical protein
VIRFSAGLVVVAIGILVGGVATSKLLLVYVAIAVSAAALVALAIGVVLKREELFGEQPRTSADAAAAGMGAGATTGQPALVGQHAYGQPGVVGQSPGAATPQAGSWPAWDADSRPAPASQPGVRQPSPPPPGAWYQEPGQGSWGAPVKPDVPVRGRHAGPSRPQTPPSVTPTAADPVIPAVASAAAPTAPAPITPPAPPPPPPAWRREPPGSDRQPPRSWFDHLTHSEPADAPAADTDRAARPVGATEDNAPGKAARAAATPKSDATKASAATEPSGTTKPGATTKATDDSATDESATVGATDNRVGGAADRGAGDDGAGDSGAAGAAGDRAAATTDEAAGAQASQTKTADAKGLDAKTAAAKSADADRDDADRVPAGIADPDTEDTEEATAAADATRPVLADAATEASAPEGRKNGKDGGRQTTAPDHSSAKQVTVVPGVPRYHTANCILIRFMGDDDLQKMTVPEATATGCTPCRACQPDTDAE